MNTNRQAAVVKGNRWPVITVTTGHEGYMATSDKGV